MIIKRLSYVPKKSHSMWYTYERQSNKYKLSQSAKSDIRKNTQGTH